MTYNMATLHSNFSAINVYELIMDKILVIADLHEA